MIFSAAFTARNVAHDEKKYQPVKRKRWTAQH
jgi:hypothetical protein